MKRRRVYFLHGQPKAEGEQLHFPLQDLGRDLYPFLLNPTDKSGAPELVMQATAQAILWHCRLGHLNRKNLDVVKKLDDNWVSFEGTVPDCGVGKSHQLTHPKTANHKVNHSFQLVFVDLMRPITPEALGGYNTSSKISNEHTKWTVFTY